MASKDPRFFVEIARVDEEERMVYGYASTESVDSYGTIIDLGSVKACLPDYLKWRNIREMHQPSAVGTAEEVTLDETGLYIGAKIVDDQAWEKVKGKVYKGFSVGGKLDYKIDNRIFLKKINEISLGDRPSNEDCTFDTFRIYQGEEEGKMKVTRLEGETPEQVIERLLAGTTADGNVLRYAGEEVWDARVAISALSDLIYLFEKEKAEDHPEAAEQTAALLTVCTNLRKFIASEIMENDPAGEGAAPVIVELAAGADNDVERVGKELSKKNIERVQAMHDHAADMGATCRVAECDRVARITAGATVAIIGADDDANVIRIAEVLKGAGIEHTITAEDVTRIAGAGADEVFRVEGFDLDIPGITGAREVIGVMVERLKELEAQPEPAKGVARVVGKEADTGGDGGKTEKTEEPPKTVGEAIARIHQGGGTKVERL